jgi:hypothetical protein
MVQVEHGRFQSRIVGHGAEPPDQLLANPQNWRVHPRRQQKALEQALDKIGWVTEVIVNQTTGHVVDGHLRVGLAISAGEPTVPVTYVELSEDEERMALASLDPITGLAIADTASLTSLLSELNVEDELGDLLRDVAGQRDGRMDPPSQEQIEERQEAMDNAFSGNEARSEEVTCPDCGATFGIQL